MLGNFKSWITVGVVASLFVLPAFVQSPANQPQGPFSQGAAKGRQGPDPFHREAILNFAKLQYTDAKGQTKDILASTMSKMWLLATPQGELRLEVVYENGDYSLIEVHNLHIIRRTSEATPVNVPVVRASLDGMAFPTTGIK